MKKHKTLYPAMALLAAMLLGSCAGTEPTVEPEQTTDGDAGPFYLYVDLPEEQSETRLSYSMQDDPLAEGRVNILVRWQKGDFIKVYEMPDAGETSENPTDTPHQTDVYTDYADYAAKFPFPAAPEDDVYYRFRCVGGEGTAHGVFEYLGLAHATVDHTKIDGETFHNVDIDLIPQHKIRKWDRFDGLVVYGNPLRNYQMRHQTSNDNMEHLHYGQRLQGHICAYNFNGWFNPNADNVEGDDSGGDSDGSTAGTRGLLLYNTGGCIFKVILGGFEDEIYGGASISIDMEGITDGNKNSEGEVDSSDPRNNSMTLLLGNKFDHQELLDPWCWSDSDTNAEHASKKTITAYVVGWPGTLEKDKKVTLSLDDPYYGKRYTWTLTKSTDVTFRENYYYIFDIANSGVTPVVTTIPQTTP